MSDPDQPEVVPDEVCVQRRDVREHGRQRHHRAREPRHAREGRPGGLAHPRDLVAGGAPVKVYDRWPYNRPHLLSVGRSRVSCLGFVRAAKRPVAVALAVAFLDCAPRASSDSARTLEALTTEIPGQLDPYEDQRLPSLQVYGNVYESLVRAGDGPGPVPGLAESGTAPPSTRPSSACARACASTTAPRWTPRRWWSAWSAPAARRSSRATSRTSRTCARSTRERSRCARARPSPSWCWA